MNSRVESCINKMNMLGAKGEPFFVLVDFEQENPLVFTNSELEDDDIAFSFNKSSDQQKPYSQKPKPSILTKHPISEKHYSKKFNTVIQELNYGNSYLVNLTCKTPIQTPLSLKQIYKTTNQPFKLYFRDQFVVFSPERFVHIFDNSIHTFPMKGTINANVDNAEERIMESQKEMAEHATITDLLRNDLSIHCKNVSVERYRYIDRIKTSHSELLQVSSHISGELSTGWKSQIGTLLFSLLPAGSVSGAPKKKTLEIIKRAEQEKRGYYTGVMGYFDGKTFDSAVLIRYIEKEEQNLFYRSGGGITTQSNLTEEFQEMINKVYIPL